jgi:heat shock protein HspQ
MKLKLKIGDRVEHKVLRFTGVVKNITKDAVFFGRDENDKMPFDLKLKGVEQDLQDGQLVVLK